MSKEKELLNIIETILKENILTQKELKKEIMSLLVKNNNARKIDGLTMGLLEGKIDGLKNKDIDILIEKFGSLVSPDQILFDTEPETELDIGEDKTLSEGQKINVLYNESLIKIQKLESELQEKKLIENRLSQVENQLKKFQDLNISKILEEHKLYSEMFKITGTQIIEVSDEDIDALYVRYKAKGVKKYGKAFVTENKIIPKSYYNIKEENIDGITK